MDSAGPEETVPSGGGEGRLVVTLLGKEEPLRVLCQEREREKARKVNRCPRSHAGLVS